jgi:hypothetical protein
MSVTPVFSVIIKIAIVILLFGSGPYGINDYRTTGVCYTVASLNLSSGSRLYDLHC